MEDKDLTTKTVASLSAVGAGAGMAVAAVFGTPVLASALIGTAIVTGIAGIFAAKDE